VYSHRIRGPLDASPLPQPLRQAASDSVGSTYDVGTELIESGRATPAEVEPLLRAANDAFMPAFHVAALVALGLLLVALLLFAALLPKEAEAVDWSYAEARADPDRHH
jgi:hypothetical protein